MSVKNGMNASLMRKTLFFSVVFFAAVCGISFFVYNTVRTRIARMDVSNEIEQEIYIDSLKLEASVERDIILALQMARSPIIVRYFSNAADSSRQEAAFDELAAYGKTFSSGSSFWINDVDHRFYTDGVYSYTLDPELPENYWYKMTLYETESYNFNINYNPDLDQTNLWVNAPVFTEDKTPVGIVGTGIPLDSFLNSIYESVRESGHGTLFFFNEAGEITGRLTRISSVKRRKFPCTWTVFTKKSFPTWRNSKTAMSIFSAVETMNTDSAT